MEIIGAIIGAFLGIVVVVLLTVAVHALFAPQWFRDGMYVIIFPFILPAAATLGAVTQIAWMLWHQGQPESAGSVCLHGGLIALALQVALACLYTQGRSLGDILSTLGALFPVTLAWTGCLIRAGFVLQSGGVLR